MLRIESFDAAPELPRGLDDLEVTPLTLAGGDGVAMPDGRVALDALLVNSEFTSANDIPRPDTPGDTCDADGDSCRTNCPER